jgi:hypothetical protein
MVAWAPLEKGDAVKSELEELRPNSLIKGIRRIIQFEEDIEFCLQPDFMKGVQLLADFNWSFDICIYHPQMTNTMKLVNQCPNVQFTLDHIGKPDIKSCFTTMRSVFIGSIKYLMEFNSQKIKIFTSLSLGIDKKGVTKCQKTLGVVMSAAFSI